MQRKGIVDGILSGIGDGIADVREKYEEAVFGRAVSEQPEAAQHNVPGWPTQQDVEPSFGSHISIRDVEPGKELPGWPTQRDAEAEQARERDREQDRGMGR